MKTDLEFIEEHFRLFLISQTEQKKKYTIEIKRVAPDNLSVVGYGIFIHTEHMTARLRYIYKDRAKALAKLDELIPEQSSIVLRLL
jgi:acyl transferase domain-containing protein